MVENRIRGIPVLQFKQLIDHSQLFHYTTSRQGGMSVSKYQSLNFSFKVRDDEQHVTENRKLLAESITIQSEKLLFPDQCHSSNVLEVKDNTFATDLVQTDALITNCRNICISVLTADCVPIMLFDPIVPAIGIVHSGWKGTVGRIVARTIEKMVSIYGTRPQNIIAGIGPSISQKNYEVGSEVVSRFEFWFADTPSVFKENPVTGKMHIDLWEANRQLLIRNGVQNQNIEISTLCTYDNPGLFYSARRDGLQSGRFASGIMLL